MKSSNLLNIRQTASQKVTQKSCCNDLCQVDVFKELVDGTREKDFTKASNP